jgi:hypothetical protein
MGFLYGRITAGIGEAFQEVDGNAARAVLRHLVYWGCSYMSIRHVFSLLVGC